MSSRVHQSTVQYILFMHVTVLYVLCIYVTVQCIGEVVHQSTGRYDWPAVSAGNLATVQCPHTRGRFATRRCTLTGVRQAEWGPPDTADCNMVSAS